MSSATVCKTASGFEVTELPDPRGKAKIIGTGAAFVAAAVLIMVSRQSSGIVVAVSAIVLCVGLVILVVGLRSPRPQPTRTQFDTTTRRITSAEVKGPDDAPLDVAFEDVEELVVSFSKLEGEKTSNIILGLKDGTEVLLASHEGEETSLIAELIRCRLEAALPGPASNKDPGRKRPLHGKRYF